MPSPAPSRQVTDNRLDRVLQVDPINDRDLVESLGERNRLSTRLWQIVLASGRWDLVLDIGANSGERLLGVELPPAARVIAHEPSPSVPPHLRRSIQESGVAIEVRSSTLSGAIHRTAGPHRRTDRVIVHATTLGCRAG